MLNRIFSRRDFLVTSAVVGTAVALPGTLAFGGVAAPGPRLSTRPRKPSRALKPGLHRLGTGGNARDALCHVPTSLDAAKPAPFMLALHGATQDGQLMVTRLQPLADALGFPLLAPDSRGMTWDGIRGDFDVDVAFIDRAMSWVFDRCNVDAKRVWLAGFSDGASYGLSLGLANGALFSRVLAFSPGFMPPAERSAPKPRIFVSHGTSDPILPIERTSRMLVPELRGDGYTVRYEEFSGGHRMPPEILTAAAEWLSR